MYKYIFLLFAIPSILTAQQTLTSGGTVGNQHVTSQEQVYQKTTFTTATLDTTTWFNIEPANEIGLYLTSTDSCVLDIYCDSRNGFLPDANHYVTYADSMTLADSVVGGANTGEKRLVLIKTTTLNRLSQPVQNQVRFRIDHRAAGAGTTAGRVMRLYIVKSVY